jgi:geranyl-CoA carboxylase alpha subunit
MKRLLIANRGEIARRILRTAQAMGIETVAVYSDADAESLHVGEATLAHRLGGTTSAQSYLRIDALIAAAQATGADAVHPGYGFLSENADFAQAVVDAGLTWVGPPPAAIRALGSKSAVKRLASALDIPFLPSYAGDDQSSARFADEAARIGYPVMVKAAAGGGGRGMRLVHAAAELPAALQSARSEAESAFGNGELLIERALLAPRHVEVQVFADTQGHCIHLGERDCSVQRRHQKLIEESPSPAVDAALRERLGVCATRLARHAGYVGAGTVEFLLHGTEFFLMEMNTRLQVEHPVTEALAGIDLVEWQLRIARGEPLPLQQQDVTLRGHAIEVRLCAEDEHFVPHAGTVQRFVPPPGLRFDHALREGTVVPPYYDSMLGKLVAHGATRDEAIARLASALDRTVVLGLPTNRRLLAACLRDPVFGAGEARIPFLAERGDALRAALATRDADSDVLLCAALWAAQAACVDGSPPSPFERPMRFRHRDRDIDARVQETGGTTLRITIADRTATVPIVRGPQARLPDGRWHLQLGALDAVVEDRSYAPRLAERGPHAAELKAPFSGRVVALQAGIGAQVEAGQTLLVIESMKLEHSIAAPRAGTVAAVAVEVGHQVSSQQLLIRFA